MKRVTSESENTEVVGPLGAIYDFRLMLEEFTQRGPAEPLFVARQSSNRHAPWRFSRQTRRRAPFTIRTSAKSLLNQQLDSPPSSPPPAQYGSKRRRTLGSQSQETYTGNSYEMDFTRLDLCAKMRLLRTMEDTDDEEALIWSSTDDDNEEEEFEDIDESYGKTNHTNTAR